MSLPLFHVSPILLSNETLILPGNWGRILNEYVVGKSDTTFLLRETVLEHIRATEFPEKPSRLHASFALPSLDAARFYKTYNHQFGVIYEVEIVDSTMPLHEGDFNLVQPKPGQRWMEGMERVARSYWRGERSTVLDSIGHPIQTDCREIVVGSPLRIVKMLAE